MMLMRRSDEIIRLVKSVIRKRQVKEEALAQAIGKARQTLNKKLNGFVPLFYDEVVAMAEFLGMPDLAGKDTEPPDKWDPRITYLVDTLMQLSTSDRREFYRAASFILETKVPKNKRKKTIRALSKPL